MLRFKELAFTLELQDTIHLIVYETQGGRSSSRRPRPQSRNPTSQGLLPQPSLPSLQPEPPSGIINPPSPSPPLPSPPQILSAPPNTSDNVTLTIIPSILEGQANNNIPNLNSPNADTSSADNLFPLKNHHNLLSPNKFSILQEDLGEPVLEVPNNQDSDSLSSTLPQISNQHYSSPNTVTSPEHSNKSMQPSQPKGAPTVTPGTRKTRNKGAKKSPHNAHKVFTSCSTIASWNIRGFNTP
ncbi:hypothetical protein M5K25_014353 [Dendrobium thyrsiflorum]|uniref:Uncharacterized protein n=1 Tax=Dendrobium thyrsiflorum TaxID=117978 RepID=A0ABD0V350_DENTH